MKEKVYSFGNIAWRHAMILQWGYVEPQNYSFHSNPFSLLFHEKVAFSSPMTNIYYLKEHIL